MKKSWSYAIAAMLMLTLAPFLGPSPASATDPRSCDADTAQIVFPQNGWVYSRGTYTCTGKVIEVQARVQTYYRNISGVWEVRGDSGWSDKVTVPSGTTVSRSRQSPWATAPCAYYFVKLQVRYINPQYPNVTHIAERTSPTKLYC